MSDKRGTNELPPGEIAPDRLVIDGWPVEHYHPKFHQAIPYYQWLAEQEAEQYTVGEVHEHAGDHKTSVIKLGEYAARYSGMDTDGEFALAA